MSEPVTFEKLQEYADKVEDEYIAKSEEQKEMQKELENLTQKFESSRIETAFSAAEWRGLTELAKSHFGKELESKASKPDETVETDDKSEKKVEL